MSDAAALEAKRFIEEEKQFHLGMLPTEQPHPETRNFSAAIARNTAEGAAMLLRVDLDIPPAAAKVFERPEFSRLVDAVMRTVRDGKRVGFSGCGATGRLAIILEKMWRVFWENAAARFPEKAALYAARGAASYSIMTGGDRALIRSVENFEDYQSFGARQVRDEGLVKGDLLVAITEGGETSSVIGTAHEAADRGLTVFFAFNNPADILSATIERSRNIIERADITKLDLFTGPMALTGSTRLQATTMEMLVVGAAVETACARIVAGENPGYTGPLVRSLDFSACAAKFEALVRDLSTGGLEGIAALIDLETRCYAGGGKVTYVCEDYLLDIVSDTTERTPTFKLPPFRPEWDTASPVSWAFVKDPSRPTREAWNFMLRRPPRGIDWTAADYTAMGGSKRMIGDPPKLGREEIYAYAIGNAPDPSRFEAPGSVLLSVTVGAGETEARRRYLEKERANYSRAERLVIAGSSPGAVSVPVAVEPTAMDLFLHLAVKLVFNTASTGTMGKMGRIRGNWMIQVDATNKKLVDRATRLIAGLGNLPYEVACTELHRTIAGPSPDGAAGDSAVVRTLKRLGRFPRE